MLDCTKRKRDTAFPGVVSSLNVNSAFLEVLSLVKLSFLKLQWQDFSILTLYKN